MKVLLRKLGRNSRIERYLQQQNKLNTYAMPVKVCVRTAQNATRNWQKADALNSQVSAWQSDDRL